MDPSAHPPQAVVTVRGALRAADVRAVCDRVQTELDNAAGHRVVHVQAEVVDLGVVDLLARLTLIARRLGADLQVVSPGDDLEVLLRLTGLERELGS